MWAKDFIMEFSWLFTVPILKLAIMIGMLLATIFMFVQIIRWSMQSTCPNPFDKDIRVPRKPYIHDQKKRDEVIKQGFSKDKIPDNLDAILIGSGIGSMTTAAIMARAGKKVLVLEQHDQAGGCCHTFIDKGYEFDVGIHYIGEMGHQTLNKTLLDQICEGQVEWAPLEDEFDVIQIGLGSESRQYPVATGMEAWRGLLHKQFPDEIKAVDKYFELLAASSKTSTIHGAMKVLPLWLVKIILFTGVLKYVTNIFRPEYTISTLDLVEGLTSNKDLQAVFMYCWGDYGTPPSKSNFTMQAALNRHFMKAGAHYPIGGASEIAYNIIPVIEKSGGRVLVRVSVTDIIAKGGKACGVKVAKGKETMEIFAPMIISSAGLYNTFERLLPKELAEKSYYTKICKDLKPGVAAMNVFLGLNKSKEELGLKRQNMWAFTTNELNKNGEDYFNLSVDEAMDADIPLLFVSFPSAKDPEWENHPGRKDKSTVAIVTLANWEWFKEWENKPLKKRGDDYDEVKNSIGHHMIEQTCQLYPQIRDCIDFTEIASPVTNKHYLTQPHGEIYGLDHSIERFDPLMVSKLRPKTDIPGLFLTGQDILSCGFTGALFAGVLGAQAALGRNVMGDLIGLHNKLEGGKASITDVRAGVYIEDIKKKEL